MAKAQRPMKNRFDWQPIRDLSDGTRTMAEIAAATGYSRALVEKVVRLENLPRASQGSRQGEQNHQWKGGDYISKYGYLMRNETRQFEHRAVMEAHLGRRLRPEEVVDHRDGCTLNNRIANLRVFESNDDHLVDNLRGKRNLPFGDPGCRHDASFLDRLQRGEIRARQILRARALLSKAEFDLLRTERYISPKQLDRLARSQAQASRL